MNCNYRNCGKEIELKEGKGRNRKFCDNKCKSMEQYYRGKDNAKKSS